ncbi:hypothetical protein MKW92_026186 [Papaver armeniacum]|nr:hypothetical protein MKW92_026186 [Papaver armeniacum]
MCSCSLVNASVYKNYNFVEESVCASSGAFVPGLAENRESTNSGSSNNDPGLENESSEGVSSGGPSSFPNLNAAHAPLRREAMRGNDFSNTVFIDDSSPSDDNISVARNDFLSTNRKEPNCNNGERFIQSTIPIGASLNFHVLSDHGLLGSGSTDPVLANESARVCRPPSIPVPDVDDEMVCQPPSISVLDVDGGMMRQPPSIPAPDVGGEKCPSSSRTPALPVKEPDYESLQNAVTEYYTQFMNSVNQLKEAHHQLSLSSGVDADARQEITRLESKNTELSAAIRVLTEELARARQELANSKSRELQLQLYLEEIGYVLPDSWEY